MLFDTIYHTYKHLWTDISLASWRKYPTPDRPDVLSVDLLSKEIDPETGVLTCTRLIICKGSMPTWLKPIVGSNECFFYEETTVDPKTQTMVLKTKNLSFSNILGLEEVCTYTPDPSNAEWTQFKQEAKVTSSVFGVARKLEAFCLERFKTNATKGRAIMEQAIQKVKHEAEEIEQTIDKAINTVVHEAEEQLHSIDKIITTAKLEAEDTFAELEAKLDKALNNVKARDASMEERITNFDKAFSSLRAELTSDRLGIPFTRTEFTKYTPNGINKSL
ncbi:slowmo family protein [Heterostelium album PN500]|uniref:Slowmo family protein n=1 Tax=Heterostelium pallidum (strain ATCC 26659 / Pp 5 / PN500) TaxID=670386 RepID=D3B6Z4_HETP5|nr:slowmo family protein [Heterostelium album PN500]EFA82537.1 slowmo family protein [Heterostelium album PN500]|eukprot:XP_020434654.1 slowmo family protein [Heterostelium album PN500]